MLFVIFERESVGEERGSTEIIIEYLYVEETCP